MNPDQTELWQRLERFQLDDPQVAFPFTARLARENGWSRGFARRVADEYRRFAFLCVAAGHPCTPSEQVDQAWHLHLIYTRSYWEGFCGGALRQPLHHGPTKGGATEGGKFHDWYARTLASYRQHFGEPPADIWPPATQRFGEDLRVERVNVARHWVIRKPAWWPVAKVAAVLGLGGLVVAGCRDAVLGYVPVFDWNGPDFLKFYAVALLSAAAITWAWLAAWRKAEEKRAASVPMPTDAYELAALTGGPERMAQTALVSLAHAKTLKLGGSDGKQLEVAGPLPETAHPVERAVYTNLLGRETGTARYAVAVTEQLPELKEIQDRQPVPPGPVGTPTQRVLIPLGLVAVVGLIKLMVGVSRDRPVGFLLALLVVNGIALVGVQLFREKMKTWRQHAAERFQRSNASVRQSILGQTEWRHEGTGIGLTAALFGVGVLSGTALADYVPLLVPPPPVRPASGSGGDSGCSSGGDGGGGDGGGCGGGGCGGCGGGGD